MLDFIDVKLIDIIDVILVALLVYYIYKLIRGTAAIPLTDGRIGSTAAIPPADGRIGGTAAIPLGRNRFRFKPFYIFAENLTIGGISLGIPSAFFQRNVQLLQQCLGGCLLLAAKYLFKQFPQIFGKQLSAVERNIIGIVELELPAKFGNRSVPHRQNVKHEHIQRLTAQANDIFFLCNVVFPA